MVTASCWLFAQLQLADAFGPLRSLGPYKKKNSAQHANANAVRPDPFPVQICIGFVSVQTRRGRTRRPARSVTHMPSSHRVCPSRSRLPCRRHSFRPFTTPTPVAAASTDAPTAGVVAASCHRWRSSRPTPYHPRSPAPSQKQTPGVPTRTPRQTATRSQVHRQVRHRWFYSRRIRIVCSSTPDDKAATGGTSQGKPTAG